MPRFKLTLEYDGAPFVGWQRQTNGLSVQEVIETAIEALCGERVRIRGAGRTDTGVHALGQVAHAELTQDLRTDVLRDGLNAHMRPQPVAIFPPSACLTLLTRDFLQYAGIIFTGSSIAARL